jgi:hypothetical protein
MGTTTSKTHGSTANHMSSPNTQASTSTTAKRTQPSLLSSFAAADRGGRCGSSDLLRSDGDLLHNAALALALASVRTSHAPCSLLASYGNIRQPSVRHALAAQHPNLIGASSGGASADELLGQVTGAASASGATAPAVGAQQRAAAEQRPAR